MSPAILNSQLAAFLQSRFSPRAWRRIRRAYCALRSFGQGDNLNKLAWAYGTDKGGHHSYTEHYEHYFQPIRKRRLAILEIGVGGYDTATEGGDSLRMWKRYFPHSQVVGIDIYDKSDHSERRLAVLQCDQTDEQKLTEVSNRFGGFDIVIDDGSHRSEHVIRSFHILFPLLKTPGIYCIEDLQSSYWPAEFGPERSMEFLKSLVDGLNYMENPEVTAPSYFDRHITEIAFFHNLCILQKGNNDEPTRFPEIVEKERHGRNIGHRKREQ